MDTSETYEVKDMKLAEQGLKNLELAELRMGALLEIRKRFTKEKPLKGVRIGMALHVTKETAILVRTLIAGGAEVAITGCNPLSTQDDVAAALAKEGVKVWAYKGETNDDYYRYLTNIISFKPHITIDDGCDLVSEIHKKHPEMIPEIIGGCEETTTGIIRLHSMEKENALKYPVVAVNDNKTKHLLDNYYGTGQSTLDGIMRASNILFAGKTVVVCGYGSCGKGVSLKVDGLGANVIVCEVDAFRALQAIMDGHRVMPLLEAAKVGDIFITLTGDKNVIDTTHMQLMKDGVLLANSGHFDAEINVKGLKETATSVRRMRPFLEEYLLEGKRIYLAGEGRLINLAAAEGHPSEVMSTSFCGQALAVEHLVKNKERLPKAESGSTESGATESGGTESSGTKSSGAERSSMVIQLPPQIDDEIARLQLTAMGVRFDELTAEQKKYLSSWEEGT